MFDTFVPERRRTARRQVFKSAHIFLKDQACPIVCIVRNRSDGGACVEVPAKIEIPDTFDIQFDAASVFRCRVIWRKPTAIGIEFDFV